MDKLDEILNRVISEFLFGDFPTTDKLRIQSKTAILNLLKELVGKKKAPKQRADGVFEVLTAEDVIRNDLIEEIGGRIDRLKNLANTGV